MVRMLLAAVSPLLIFALVGQAAAQTCISPSYGLVSWWDGDTMYGTTALIFGMVTMEHLLMEHQLFLDLLGMGLVLMG